METSSVKKVKNVRIPKLQKNSKVSKSLKLSGISNAVSIRGSNCTKAKQSFSSSDRWRCTVLETGTIYNI